MKYIVSRYNHKLNWIVDYTDDVVLYDRSEQPMKDAIIMPNIGSDIYDKLTFIIDNYDNLPEVAVYTKANLFDYLKPKEFEKIKDNKTFTPILSEHHQAKDIDLEAVRQVVQPLVESQPIDQETKDLWYRFNCITPNEVQPKKRFSYYENGIYWELNMLQYLKILEGHEKEDLYRVREIQQLLGIYDLEYIPFAPGSNYILPRENILKHPKNLYEKLREYLATGLIINGDPYPREAMIIERGLYTLWH